MDDSILGRSDKRGDWKPNRAIEYPPVFVWPPRPIAFFKWLFGYGGFIFPWNALCLLIAVLVYSCLTPAAETTKSWAWAWTGLLLARNYVFALLIYGGLHLLCHVRRRQGTQFKFNGRWPQPGNAAFLFRDQVYDNAFWTLLSGVPIWTAYEAFMLWAISNDHLPFSTWAAHPLYNVFLCLLIPLWRDLHFYLVHRMLHIPVIYRWVHKLHHTNVNPISWSGLAMHPVEHALYFSCVLIHLVVPSHPVHLLFNIYHAAFFPAIGHVGFDRLDLAGIEVETGGYPHYLHHKYFECNYADGTLPLDKLFGTFHDGTPESLERMNAWLLRQAGKSSV